ncbi:probable low-specificity L-threonine aldolase 2 isoform X2 [Cryptomeria japonica]|uniref:probable low-specificity L-threonine aldolase 2 isoform X2 n=1 Tax=Cryptomeria japonica TaxID=3369 RepID=UPI0027DA52DF|nr:probable low-specificity L-threonine aldolase 2 isoform X2 [Cryptomeria japonica]
MNSGQLSEKMMGLVLANGEMKRVVDVRSDTVTKPTDAMRVAMAQAQVDDDVLCSDPTAATLQQQMAKIMGKEAALFVPSGTMGNLISVLVHCEVRGSEVIVGSNSHIHVYENGGISTIGHVYPHLVENETDGTMDIKKVEAAIRPSGGDDMYYATTRLICIENTHANGGRCITAEYTDKIGELAKHHGLKLHVDGARIFNASTALGVPVDRLVQAADSVSVCLSKGLGAPVGTVIVGSHEFIAKAKKLRKTLGGGMRQVGVLCAAGLIALNDMVGRLREDHKNCRILAESLNAIDGFHVRLDAVETNIVFVDLSVDSAFGAEELCEAMKEKGILFMPVGHMRFRLVTHHQISEDDVRYAIACFRDISVRLQTRRKIT